MQREGHTETIDEDVDEANAESVLTKFAQLDGGGDAQRPNPLKCNNCEFRDECGWRKRN